MAGLGLFIHSLMGMIKDNKENKGSQKPVIVPYDEIITGQINNHNYVDLGLPSGLKWATCNVGANSPEEFGNYYAWGETQTKDNYYARSAKFSVVDTEPPFYETLTKYNTDKKRGPIDGITQLELVDDAARVNWGDSWRTPSKKDFEELINFCTFNLSSFRDVRGTMVTGPNGNSIFLPRSGYMSMGSPEISFGRYWSSSLSEKEAIYSWYLYLHPIKPLIKETHRSIGNTVRAVI